MQSVTSFHFQSENESIHDTKDHLWCLNFCSWGRQQEAQAAVNREKRRENKILFNNPWVSDNFVLLPAMIMNYSYDSA